MGDYTTFLNLYKPDPTELVDVVEHVNDNYDKLDTQFGNFQNSQTDFQNLINGQVASISSFGALTPFVPNFAHGSSMGGSFSLANCEKAGLYAVNGDIVHFTAVLRNTVPTETTGSVWDFALVPPTIPGRVLRTRTINPSGPYVTVARKEAIFNVTGGLIKANTTSNILIHDAVIGNTLPASANGTGVPASESRIYINTLYTDAGALKKGPIFDNSNWSLNSRWVHLHVTGQFMLESQP